MQEVMTMAEPRSIDELRGILREHLPVLRERYAIEWLGVFGSYVRGEETPRSDLDLLVRFRVTPGLLRFVELENALGDLLGVHVDLVMAESLKPHIGERVLAEVQPL
jgi:predicted nucleotidyltransferase